MDYKDLPESDPRFHTGKIKEMLRHVADHVGDDVSKIEEPKAQACLKHQPRCWKG